MSKLILLLGGNQGDVKEHFCRAIEAISKKIGKIEIRSHLYQSEPWGFQAKELFLNQVLIVETSLTPFNLLDTTQKIEQQIGRTEKTRGKGYASRKIDIDILFYDNIILNTPDLVIPHPKLHLRNFTLLPLAEICPNLTHPVLQQTISELIETSPDQSECKPLEP